MLSRQHHTLLTGNIVECIIFSSCVLPLALVYRRVKMVCVMACWKGMYWLVSRNAVVEQSMFWHLLDGSSTPQKGIDVPRSCCVYNDYSWTSLIRSFGHFELPLKSCQKCIHIFRHRTYLLNFNGREIPTSSSFANRIQKENAGKQVTSSCLSFLHKRGSWRLRLALESPFWKISNWQHWKAQKIDDPSAL